MAQTKQQKELIALAALVVIAGSVWYFYMGRSAATNSGFSTNNKYTEINAQDYGRILIDLTKAQGTEYKSAGRNIFVMGALPVDVAKEALIKQPFPIYNQPQLEIKPPANLPMVFFGYGMLPAGGPRQAFLKEDQGDEVHIVSEGDVVLNHIRILHIGNDKIEFEDTTTGQKGSKNLEATPSA
jgi:hypothetical protein